MHFGPISSGFWFSRDIHLSTDEPHNVFLLLISIISSYGMKIIMHPEEVKCVEMLEHFKIS